MNIQWNGNKFRSIIYIWIFILNIVILQSNFTEKLENFIWKNVILRAILNILGLITTCYFIYKTFPGFMGISSRFQCWKEICLPKGMHNDWTDGFKFILCICLPILYSIFSSMYDFHYDRFVLRMMWILSNLQFQQYHNFFPSTMVNTAKIMRSEATWGCWWSVYGKYHYMLQSPYSSEPFYQYLYWM